MAKTRAGVSDPLRLAAFDKRKNVQVVIETPRGSRNKYAWDTKQRVFTLKKVLPEGMVFPYDFGFIPSTKAEDGDPVDVLLLMDESAFPGCVITSRIVGIIEGKQTQKGKTERNDRLLAVAETSHTHSNIKSINDLNPSLLKEIEQFFVNYHLNDGADFKVLVCKGPDAAMKQLAKNTNAKRRK